MLFRRRKNIIFALRIRSELPMSTAFSHRLNAAELRVSGSSGIFSGVRKILFRRRKNIIFALRIRSELPMSTALESVP
ncbi:Uncharacterized protein dnm_005660 [Desulfonema magnum]|uniref:Uncharacterized protein n=1 Tax=Desulfonema magnum TaxID=45655 RepID=A0A975GL89_9BACT|nr:Uncharacterized protein dnm_005660 [Desulfonema magnum]